MAFNSNEYNILHLLNHYIDIKPYQFSMIEALINQYLNEAKGEQYINDKICNDCGINDQKIQNYIDEPCYFDEIFSELGVDCVTSPSPMALMSPLDILSEQAVRTLPSNLSI